MNCNPLGAVADLVSGLLMTSWWKSSGTVLADGLALPTAQSLSALVSLQEDTGS
ncbi:hypothetical protein WOLCODRAFT_29238 [Wolfiporia cocos MD-104 SS10]|uniref:Uncharacterized protein n=1 Tax=Wolfiporia cocos (strain MD-104) TaxID=742152 RepID=A0A2H3JGB2_WOLCO|nr:hypothetical protein WOLCODRAFT_29238 [Wolfiporia cocos MD-104 SS10]